MSHVSGLKIGTFMVAVGAIIEDAQTGNILLVKRESDFLAGTWEVVYGRIDQFEELEQALRREVQEEVGITDLEIKRLVRVWHIFRGEKAADKEVYGFTFHCLTHQKHVKISDEHSAYEWVPPEQAIDMVSAVGIKKDLQFFVENLTEPKIAISDLDGNNHFIF